jgi:pyruvate dehydrogenase E1 component
VPDIDPEETQEWLESLDGVIDEQGRTGRATSCCACWSGPRDAGRGAVADRPPTTSTPSRRAEPWFPGDEDIERRIRAWIRWNAAIMVHRAQRPGVGVGGHISTYASAATLYEVGFNHFFRGKDHPGGGDQIFFQGHASPGMYARAFLEGRLRGSLDGFRQEKSHTSTASRALPSYPHPRLMPDFWEFPTVSMGLGPMNAIYQAQFNRYLHNRGIKDTSQQRVWAFLGDGEMDEPESRGALQLAAANEELDNLTFVVNCNLQRLDGPVRGNGKIIQELEAFFRGAGWNVIKVVWGRGWDDAARRRRDGALVNLMNTTPTATTRPSRPTTAPTSASTSSAATRAPQDGRGLDRRRDLVEAQARRPRLPQGVRRLQGRHRAHRPADGHPGQDDQGLHLGVSTSPAATRPTR